MQIKETPEDFVVEEVIKLNIKPNGEYSYFLLEKRNWTTLKAIELIANNLNAHIRRFSFAGQKDRAGITKQYISAFKVPRKNIENLIMKDMKITFVGYGDNPISLGDLEGNKFTILARDLVNEPASVMTPSFLAETALKIAKANPQIKAKILDKEQVEKLGMNAYLGIDQGSEEPLKFIHLIYQPKTKAKEKIALVGKGITFDSGGLNIKVGEGMTDMKVDMAGAATVLGVFSVIAGLKIKAEVHGIIAACENMPSGKAIKPGDVVKNMQGKTIEIGNTDAEGRVILSDALEYAKRYKPALVVDVATLTGACIHAVGEEYAGLFTRDAKIKKCIEDAAEMTNEPVWQLPLDDSHVHSIKSYVADVKNIGERKPGASTAAAFLEFFTDYPWAHLDIAGQMAYGKPQPFQRQGARGFGVHLLTQVVRNWFKV